MVSVIAGVEVRNDLVARGARSSPAEQVGKLEVLAVSAALPATDSQLSITRRDPWRAWRDGFRREQRDDIDERATRADWRQLAGVADQYDAVD